MSIRLKTIIIVGVTIVIMMTLSNLFASKFFISKFDAIELEQTINHMERVQNVFEQQLEYLSNKSSDWAVWDDAYKFVSDRNKEFIITNLEDSTFHNLKIETMIFVDEKAQMVHATYLPLDEDERKPVPVQLLQEATTSAVLLKMLKEDVPVQGVLLIDNNPMVFAGRSIIKSSGDGPIKGYILFGRFLSKSYVNELGAILKLPLEIQVIPSHGEVYDHIMGEFTGSKIVHIQAQNERELEAERIFIDIYGKKILYVHVTLPRRVHLEGVSVIRYFGGISAGVGLLMLIILGIVLDRLILRRVVKLSHDVSSLDILSTKTISIAGDAQNDEISNLIRVMNGLFHAQAQSQYLLKDQQLKIQQYFDNAGVMIVVISMNQMVVNINKKLTEVLGFEEADIVGKNWFETVLSPSDATTMQHVFSKLTLGDSRSYDYIEHTVITKSGETKLIGWHNSLLKNDQGQVMATLSSGEDITVRNAQEAAITKKNAELETTKLAVLNILDDQKILEEQLKTERDRATTIISSMSEGLFVVDRERKVTLVNTAASILLGFPVSEILGRNVSDFIPSDRAGIEISASYSLGDDQYIEGKNGKIPVSISIVPLKHEDVPTGALITFHDISKDKLIKETIEKEVALRTQEIHDERAKLVASINSLNMGYLLMDTSGKPLMANSLLSSVLGSSNTVMTIEDIDVMFGDSLDLIHRFKNCIVDKKIIKESGVNFRGKILKIWLIPVVVVVNAEDKVLGAVFLVEDVTERKMMERSKDEFFSIASHELRTPLTAIRGNTSMILDFYGDKIPDKDMKEMIEDIHASSIRLINIVNDFLNVSRFEQGKIEFKKTNFDLRDLASESVLEFEGSALEKHVVVRFEDSGEMPQVFADRDRAKQAMLNLVGNSLKFTEKGEVVVRIVKDGDMLLCRVNDSGRGVSKDYQNLLFRKFQQAGSSLFTRDTTKGTGLGLYISRLIIEGMGGKIWLEKSEEGVGSEFCFTLPIAK